MNKLEGDVKEDQDRGELKNQSGSKSGQKDSDKIKEIFKRNIL